MKMNRWNMLHILAPLVSVLIALFILDGKPAISNGVHYYPETYIVFALLIVGLSSLFLFPWRETLYNFLIFFPSYIFWLFAALVPYFATEAVNGAIDSSIVLILGFSMNWIVWGVYSQD